MTNANNNFSFNNPSFKSFNGYRSSMEFYRLKLSKSKLKAVTRTSALLSGFAMVAMVELNLDYGSYVQAAHDELNLKMKLEQLNGNRNLMTMSNNNDSMAINATTTTPYTTTTPTFTTSKQLSPENFLIPQSILIIYSIVTCLLVGVHMLALMISTCILPQIEASSFESLELEQHLQRQEMQQSKRSKKTMYEANELLLLNTKNDDDTMNDNHLIESPMKLNTLTSTAGIPLLKSLKENQLRRQSTKTESKSFKTPENDLNSDFHQENENDRTINLILNSNKTTPKMMSSDQTNDPRRMTMMITGLNSNLINDNNSYFIFPYGKFHRFIELAWISSTVIGIFLFLVEIGLVCYIKFYPISFVAAMAGAVVMLPILILFVLFTITFYKRLAGFKVNLTKTYLDQVDRNLMPLNDTTII